MNNMGSVMAKKKKSKKKQKVVSRFSEVMARVGGEITFEMVSRFDAVMSLFAPVSVTMRADGEVADGEVADDEDFLQLEATLATLVWTYASSETAAEKQDVLDIFAEMEEEAEMPLIWETLLPAMEERYLKLFPTLTDPENIEGGKIRMERDDYSFDVFEYVKPDFLEEIV